MGKLIIGPWAKKDEVHLQFDGSWVHFLFHGARFATLANVQLGPHDGAWIRNKGGAGLRLGSDALEEKLAKGIKKLGGPALFITNREDAALARVLDYVNHGKVVGGHELWKRPAGFPWPMWV